MIWVAGIFLIVAVLLIVVAPLLGRYSGPSVRAALQEQKIRVADELAFLSRKRESGVLTEEEFTAQRQALETEAVALIEAEKQAPDSAREEGRYQRIAKLLTAAIIFLVVANVSFGIYLYLGGWQNLSGESQVAAQGPAMGQSSPAPGTPGGPTAEDMVSRLEERLRENPDNPQGQAMLGRSYLVMERFGDSVAAYQKAVKLAPDNAEYKIGLGVATIRMGDLGTAEDVFRTILDADPQNREALWFTGVLEVQSGEADKARATFDKLLTLTPEGDRPQVEEQVQQMMDSLGG